MVPIQKKIDKKKYFVILSNFQDNSFGIRLLENIFFIDNLFVIYFDLYQRYIEMIYL